MDKSEEIYLIGYWNSDINNPKIIFNIPENLKEWTLVQIAIKDLKPFLGNEIKSSELAYTNKLNRGNKKLSEALRNLKNVK